MLEGLELTENDSEEQLVEKAQFAVSRCNWFIGQCSVQWTRKYARGRTDADFAAQVGLSADQVFQRRRVWETFGDVYREYRNLKWSHFYVALNWEDAPECLQWADENEATVAEMKAWRRAVQGETTADEMPYDSWSGDPLVSQVPTMPTPVRDPEAYGEGAKRPAPDGLQPAGRDDMETVAGVARESDERGYAPFRSDAGSPPPAEEASATAVAAPPRPSAEQLLHRMSTTLERMNNALTPAMIEECRALSDKTLDRFLKAVGALSAKAGELMEEAGR